MSSFALNTGTILLNYVLWVQDMFLARCNDSIFDSYIKNQLDALISQIYKIVHLVGFIIRIYNDALSHERQHFRYSLYIVPASF